MMIILVIALLVLGPKRLPGAGKALGNGMREFKESLSGGSDRDRDRDFDVSEQPPRIAA